MDRNARFLLRSLRKHYKERIPPMPHRFTRREFGFMFFGRDYMQRHMSFGTQDEMRRFLVSQVPRHSYYSTAYYRYPAAATMDEKEWLGAELIFDLDADHLEGAGDMSYDDMMVRIRGEMIRLVDSFLLDDLGFDEDDIQICFSGGRGYHAHVTRMDVLTLGTHERRELVDYITCSGMSIDWVFPVDHRLVGSAVVAGQTRRNIAEIRTVPAADAGGWRLRMRRGLMEVVEDVCSLDPTALKKAYPSIKGSGSTGLLNLQERLRPVRDSLFEKNDMSLLNKRDQELLVKIMREDKSRMLAGEVDKPVTPDIKRLIRLPGSVHGRTGLEVTTLTRRELTDYEPLDRSVPSAYSDDPVRVTMRRPYELRMKGERFSLAAGETEVPEYAAVFLIGRGEADLGHASERSGADE
jgi:DNA primase small subunit